MILSIKLLTILVGIFLAGIISQSVHPVFAVIYGSPIGVSEPHPGVLDFFGKSVSISGNMVLISSPGNATAGLPGSGAVYLYDVTTGNLIRSFTEPTPVANNAFGNSISISDNNVLISSSNGTAGLAGLGAVYLFEASTGKLVHTFAEPHPATLNYFGKSVSVSGDHILIGSRNVTAGLAASGAVYLFDASTGKLVHTFAEPHPATLNDFGKSISISGNNILISSFNATAGLFHSGAVYLFDAATGKLVHTFAEPRPSILGYFGKSVSVSGNNVLISSNNATSGLPGSGAVYLYNSTSGKLVRIFNELHPSGSNPFGSSVSISGNNILISSNNATAGLFHSGAVYLFDATPGDLIHTFAEPHPALVNTFGISVSISDDYIVIGSVNETEGLPASGAAYLFTPLRSDIVPGGSCGDKCPPNLTYQYYLILIIVLAIAVFAVIMAIIIIRKKCSARHLDISEKSNS